MQILLRMIFAVPFLTTLPSVQAIDDENDTCERYMAPSLFVGSGVGIYAGKEMKTGEYLELMPMLAFIPPSESNWQLAKYTFEGLRNHLVEEHVVGFGPSMIYNHHENPHLILYRTTDTVENPHISSQIDIFLHTLSYSAYPKMFNGVLRDVAPGDEIYFHYGNEWFKSKEIPYTNSSLPLVESKRQSYSMEELAKVGQCISYLYDGDSTNEEAGSGMFAARTFKKGELLQVSPVLVHSKREILEVSDETSVLINYCISRPDSDVALLPITLVALINHGGEQANAEMEWFFWSDDEATRSILHTDPNELCQLDAARLYLGYRATRDISKGEEVMIEYGIDWEQDWAEYLEMRESFRIFEEPLPLFRRAIDAPEGLFPDHWLVDCIGEYC